jgi:DNA ligase-1
MTRRRKHEIEKTLQKIRIEFFVFDLLSKNGQSLMDKDYQERRKELEKVVKPGKILKLVGYEVTKDPKRINDLYKQRAKEGYEGIIVKKANATYVPGRTGWRWVKMKQEGTSTAKLADTVDAVVMGYTLGKGKRAQFGVGQFLVGIKKNEKYVTTTKIGTGLTDEQLREMSERLKKLRVKEKPKEYELHRNYIPDYWVIPSLVVEIAADEITVSPTHTAGLALRFPRLVRFRDDKSPKDITTAKELQKMFKIQKI